MLSLGLNGRVHPPFLVVVPLPPCTSIFPSISFHSYFIRSLLVALILATCSSFFSSLPFLLQRCNAASSSSQTRSQTLTFAPSQLRTTITKKTPLNRHILSQASSKAFGRKTSADRARPTSPRPMSHRGFPHRYSLGDYGSLYTRDQCYRPSCSQSYRAGRASSSCCNSAR
jgi:hypothetical protein